jgi:hypothetical protein
LFVITLSTTNTATTATTATTTTAAAKIISYFIPSKRYIYLFDVYCIIAAQMLPAGDVAKRDFLYYRLETS